MAAMTRSDAESRTGVGQERPEGVTPGYRPVQELEASWKRFSWLLQAEAMIEYAERALAEVDEHELREELADLRRSVKLAKNIEREKIIPADG